MHRICSAHMAVSGTYICVVTVGCWWRWLPLVAPTDIYPPKAAAPKHRHGRTCNGYHDTYSSMQARTGNTHQSTMLYDV